MPKNFRKKNYFSSCILRPRQCMKCVRYIPSPINASSLPLPVPLSFSVPFWRRLAQERHAKCLACRSSVVEGSPTVNMIYSRAVSRCYSWAVSMRCSPRVNEDYKIIDTIIIGYLSVYRFIDLSVCQLDDSQSVIVSVCTSLHLIKCISYRLHLCPSVYLHVNLFIYRHISMSSCILINSTPA